MTKSKEFIDRLIRQKKGVLKPEGEVLAEAERQVIQLADAMRSRRARGRD